MTPDSISAATFLVIKLFALLGLLVYVMFAGIMLRQEQLMARTLAESFQPVLRMLTIVHLIAAIIVFFLGVLFL